MPIAWHPKRWRNFGMSVDDKMKKNQFYISNVFSV